ncbi:MAG: hypothetical protein KDA25_00425 [Phycisphaerales bacterium]|nr:hypothetical protein [Phycisphaerales bacterium]
MSFASKTSSLQAYHLSVYRAALHPEFFQIDGRRKIEHGGYDFESWIYRGGHVVRFQYEGLCVTEVVSESMDSLPDRGLVTSLPCAGEKDHEGEFADRIAYVTTMQTETLSDHLYLGTYNEMLEHGRMGDCLMSVWTDGHPNPNLSLVDMQRYSDEVHVQGYHLRSDCGLVLRTQSIFQLKAKRA